jgi:hypothetical protein
MRAGPEHSGPAPRRRWKSRAASRRRRCCGLRRLAGRPKPRPNAHSAWWRGSGRLGGGVGHRCRNSTAGSYDDRAGRASLVMMVMENPMAPASVRLPGSRGKLHVDMKFRPVEWRNSRAICRPRKTCQSRITQPKFAIPGPNRGQISGSQAVPILALGRPSGALW